MADHSADFNEASKAFAYKVLDALGAEKSFWGGYVGVWDAEDFREILEKHSPTEVLDAIATAQPSAATFINLVKDDPALASKFHERAVNDPDFLTRMGSLASGAGNGFDLDKLAGKPYGPAVLEKIQPHLMKLLTDDTYTIAQLKADATPAVLETLTDHLRTLDADKRFEFMENELTSMDPNMKSLFDSLNNAPAEVKTAVGNAIAHNPAFSEYLITKFSADGGGTSLAGIFKNMDADQAGAVADIMTTIANGDGYTSLEDFQKLDRVLTAADAQARALDELNKFKKDHPSADASTLESQYAAASADLLIAAKAAGANIPAFAMLDQQMMMDFLKDLFNPNVKDPAKFALGNLAEALQLSGADLAAFNQLMGPLAEIMNFMFKPYAELYQNHSSTIGNDLSSVANNAGRLFGSERVQFQAPAPAPVTGSATTMTSDAFNAAWDDATAKTFDAVSAELLEVDPKLVEELKAIKDDPTLRGKFEHAVTSTATPEELEAAARAFQAEIARGSTVEAAVNKIAPGGG